MKILITGASGFVGNATCASLRQGGHDVVPAVREAKGLTHERVVGPIDGHTDWHAVLDGVQGVIHLAARVHVMREYASDPMQAFLAVNTLGTLNLARQCAAAGIKRFVFVSSIKVNGESRDAPYGPSDRPSPQDPYAVSKWKAEQGLRQIEATSTLKVVIVRPPLIYGPGVGANFRRLMQSVHAGWPLPFGRVTNRRSLLYVGNLANALECCLAHPKAAGRTFLLSDGHDVSSAELVRRMARALDRPARLLPLPPAWLRAGARLTGHSAEMDRILGSLTLDASLIEDALGWQPPFSLDAGLRQTADDFLRHTDTI